MQNSYVQRLFRIYEDMCRLCLGKHGKHFINERLIQDIFICTGLQMSFSDDLPVPSKLCTDCVYKIDIALDLREYATNNDLYMRTLMNNKEQNLTLKLLSPSVPTGRVHQDVRTISTQTKPLCSEAQSSTIKERPSNSKHRKRKSNNDGDETPQAQKSRITVRSLQDINSGAPPSVVSSSTKDKLVFEEIKTSEKVPPRKKKISRHNSEKSTTTVKSLSGTNTGVPAPVSSSTKEKLLFEEIITPEKIPTRKKKTSRHKREKSTTIVGPLSDSNTEVAAPVDPVSSSTRDKTSPPKDENISKTEVKSESKEEYKCDICKKIYPTAKKVYLHKRSHAKKLYCPLDVCGKTFATKGDLQKHIRAHTGEKPYACDLCDRKFTQNVSLKAHKVALHGPKDEKCDETKKD